MGVAATDPDAQLHTTAHFALRPVSRRAVLFALRSLSPSSLMLRIALPNKGRLADEARELFNDAGLDVRAPGDRALTASLGGEFQALFVRAQDIPEFVADGAADAGITGWDLVAESNRELDVLLDLEFGRCRLAVAATEESGIASASEIPRGTRVATSFPRLTRRFFTEMDRQIELVPVTGAAEIAPHIGIADVIVDLVSTGSTLRVNGLLEIATVLESTARLVVTRGAIGGTTPPRVDREKVRALDELSAALESVIRARGKRYVMANVPKDRLADVRRILPGLNGPTVVDILDGGTFVAVHAVTPAATVYRAVAELKALGAEGILVTRIERLMP
jgi:ATP phosphoribosyltransferase